MTIRKINTREVAPKKLPSRYFPRAGLAQSPKVEGYSAPLRGTVAASRSGTPPSS